MRYIDLFAGIGGFRYGLEQVGGFECMYSNEWDRYANSVYRRHYDTCDISDIRTIDTKDIPEHDLLVGGFPCQSFSVAGRRGGFADTRGTLFFEIARILEEKHPRLLLLENVKGLLSHEGGETFRIILTTLDGIGYDCQWQVCNSKDFGVPQNRARVYIVGHLRGTPRPEVFPLFSKSSQVDCSCTDEQPGTQKFIKTRHLSQNGTLVSDAITLQATELPHIAKTVRVGGRNSPYGSKQNWDAYELEGTIRRLTPIECERLQGFPDDWTKYGFKGGLMSDTQRYKMCGNAVTTSVITEIGRRLL